MAKLAEIIGLSFTDMVDITTWALLLVIFGVFFGNILSDLFCWFGETFWMLVRRLVVFISDHFSKRLENRKGEHHGI